MDSFPQIIDISEDIIRDIEVNDSDGLVETSHFMVDYNLSHSIILAMEHNHQGGKSNDLLKYINFVSSKYGIDKIMIEPYIKDSLETFVERIQRCAYFRARVKKEHIPAIQNLNGKLYTALDTAQELGKSDIVEILLTSDYRKKGETTAMTNLVRDLARRLFNQRSFAKNFEVLEAKAEDSDNFHRLEIFDLLSDKLKSLVRVQRRDRVKVIISSDMFLNLEIEINRHFK